MLSCDSQVRYRFDLLRSESGKATHHRQTARARARAEEAIRSEIKAGEFGTKLMTLVEGQEKVKKKTERKKVEEATVQGTVLGAESTLKHEVVCNMAQSWGFQTKSEAMHSLHLCEAMKLTD